MTINHRINDMEAVQEKKHTTKFIQLNQLEVAISNKHPSFR